MEYYNDTVTVWHYVTGLDGDKDRYRQAIERLKCKCGQLDPSYEPGPNGPRWVGYSKKNRKLVPNFKITPELVADPIYQALTAEFYEFMVGPDCSKTDYIRHVMSQLWARVIDLTFTPWNVDLWVKADHLTDCLFWDVHLHDVANDCSYTRCLVDGRFETREFPDKYENWRLTNDCTFEILEDEEEEWQDFGKVYSFDGLSADDFCEYLHNCCYSENGHGDQPLSGGPSIWPGYNRIVDNNCRDAIKVLLDGYIKELVHRTAEDCGLYCIL